MSYDLNRWVGIGRLTRDPTKVVTTTGTSLCKFTIAVGGRVKDGVEHTNFLDIVSIGKLADNICAYQHKGNQIAIDGHIEQNNYTDKSGNKRTSFEIVAEKVEFLTHKPKQETEQNVYINSDPQPQAGTPEDFFEIGDGF